MEFCKQANNDNSEVQQRKKEEEYLWRETTNKNPLLQQQLWLLFLEQECKLQEPILRMKMEWVQKACDY